MCGAMWSSLWATVCFFPLLGRCLGAGDYSQRAALCISGQMRTFLDCYESLAPLRRQFPGGSDIFMFVSLNESYRKSLKLVAYHGTQAADTRVGKGGFTVTSTFEFSDELCHGKGPLFENSTRDGLSVQLI